MELTNRNKIEIIEHYLIVKDYIFSSKLFIGKIAKNLMLDYNLVKHEIIKYKSNGYLILESGK